MKKILVALMLAGGVMAQSQTFHSPDGRLSLELGDISSTPTYAVGYDNHPIVLPSAVGLKTNLGDFGPGARVSKITVDTVHRAFAQDRIKKQNIDYTATHIVAAYEQPDGKKWSMEWELADNDIAFRYLVPRQGDTGSMVVDSEATSFTFPEGSTAFVTPQSDAMIGWKRTKPSYEEFYAIDAPMDTPSQYGHGFTFPALFRIGNDGWVLLTESGVDGYYCGSHLSDYVDGRYTIAYAMPEENNGNGSAAPGIALPGKTPWRILTVGADLAPIVETTGPWNVVEPRYTLSRPAATGRGTWSWIMWQDDSINFEDQIAYIDFAAEMGYENVLIDCAWDTNIGYDRMRELFAYARSKGVNPIIWYSSSGHWNDIIQSPINKMDRPIVRKKEMKWLHDNGIRSIKVDFFGGDKQETMRLYEDILSDAADYGIDVVFHGCTMPRGWERMYPNYVGSEAVLASENLIFGQQFCDMEALHATLHPFIRNAAGIMEYGGTVLNKRLNRGNDGGTTRRTGDAFQLATSILFQNPVQNFALAPNNLTDAPAEAIEFMKNVPTTWTDTRYLAGYPGKYVVLARRHNGSWYIAGVNAKDKVEKVTVDLAALGVSATQIDYLSDDAALNFRSNTAKVKNGKVTIDIAPNGGFVAVVR